MDKLELKSFLMTYLLSLAAFFTPVAGMVLLVTIAVVIDTFVGISHAKWKGEVVTSGKARIGFIRKMITYSVGLLFAFLLDHLIINDFVKLLFDKDYLFTIVTTLFLISLEYSSVDEKVRWMSGKGITERVNSFIRNMKDIIIKAKDIKSEL